MKFWTNSESKQNPKIGDIIHVVYHDTNGYHAINGRITKVDSTWGRFSSQNNNRKNGVCWYGEMEVIDDSRNGLKDFFKDGSGGTENCMPTIFGYSDQDYDQDYD